MRKRHERSHSSRHGNADFANDGPVLAESDVLTVPPNLEADQRSPNDSTQDAANSEPEDSMDVAVNWLEPLEPSVSLDDFDFGSLDNFLNDVMYDWVQGTNNSQYYYDGLVPPTVQQSRARTPNAETGGVQDRFAVDQQYSNDILRQLKPVQQQFDTTYSADYLNLCLQLYFTHFHPIFPVVHAGTFRPRSWNILLTISMCSIGSLFIGSPEATAQGHQLYGRLNKAILASWENHLSEPKQSTLPIVQAAMLGQTFGLLSGKSGDRFMTEMFQGTLLVWARKLNAFRMTEQEVLKTRLTGTALSHAWRAWARDEECRRLGLALYIHDTETAGLFLRDPLLRHQHTTYSLCSTDSVFEASTAEEWHRRYLRDSSRSGKMSPMTIAEWIQRKHDDEIEDPLSSCIASSSFVAYAILANLGAQGMELVRLEVPPSTDLEANAHALARWYSNYVCKIHDGSADPQCLRVLCHHYSMLLYADMASLETAMGHHSKPEDIVVAQDWATSPRASCAMLHASLLQKHAAEMKLGTVPPIHLPRAVFSAGLVFTAFNRFSSPARTVELMSQHKSEILNMPGAAAFAQGIGQQPAQMACELCDNLTRRLPTLRYSCINLLRKLSQWGVSEVFAESLHT